MRNAGCAMSEYRAMKQLYMTYAETRRLYGNETRTALPVL